MTGYQSKKAIAQDKLVVTDIDGHIVRDVRKPKKAQPAQEPVANDRALKLVTHLSEQWKAYALELQERLVKYEGGAPMLLNITPPQRTWVGLTDDEIEDLFQSAAGADEETHLRFAKAVEAAIKKKNT